MTPINYKLESVDIILLSMIKSYPNKPTSKEELFNILKELDKNIHNREEILKRIPIMYKTITDYYSTVPEEKIQAILKYI